MRGRERSIVCDEGTSGGPACPQVIQLLVHSRALVGFFDVLLIRGCGGIVVITGTIVVVVVVAAVGVSAVR